MNLFNNIYKNKTVLVTGHTGFKGSWLSIWLNEIGAHVVGYSLDDGDIYGNFQLSGLKDKIVHIKGDIRDKENLEKVFSKYNPEYVFHLAAQPLVRESYLEPIYTYEVNLMGTLNILECIRHSKSVQVGILITTDKCYENKGQVWGYREIDSLGGYDPYSASKATCEIAIESWRKSFMNIENFMEHKKAIASVRAGNVIGGGDWAKDRIIPDCIKAIESSEDILIRNPEAIRPWQHVLEPIRGYLLLGARLKENPCKYSGAWNFGPTLDSVKTVREIAKQLVLDYGSGKIKYSCNKKDFHEAEILNLDISKSTFKLNWYPKMNINKTIEMTVDWYKNYKNSNVYDLCVRQIREYIEL